MPLVPGRWHHVALSLPLEGEAAGAATLLLDGELQQQAAPGDGAGRSALTRADGEGRVEEGLLLPLGARPRELGLRPLAAGARVAEARATPHPALALADLMAQHVGACASFASPPPRGSALQALVRSRVGGCARGARTRGPRSPRSRQRDELLRENAPGAHLDALQRRGLCGRRVVRKAAPKSTSFTRLAAGGAPADSPNAPGSSMRFRADVAVCHTQDMHVGSVGGNAAHHAGRHARRQLGRVRAKHVRDALTGGRSIERKRATRDEVIAMCICTEIQRKMLSASQRPPFPPQTHIAALTPLNPSNTHVRPTTTLISAGRPSGEEARRGDNLILSDVIIYLTK